VATVQHADARKLLTVIAVAVKRDQFLTYKTAAERLGRTPPENHSRAVAQMCDLLDAAAALAGVPLLALVKILTNTGEINPKAWKESRQRRRAIIERSNRHRFTAADFKAISFALKQLEGRGNRAAWKYVRQQPVFLKLFHSSKEFDLEANSSAINDIGTDSPDRAKSVKWTYARDPKIRETVMRRANGKCELCGKPGFKQPDGKHYLESHHIISLANEGSDRLTNVIALCPNHHREAHFGERGEELEKEMILKLSIMQRTSGPNT
jgi:5-methylcytosine-specific restriction endonuclease McrA